MSNLAPSQPLPASLLALAPLDLPNHRRVRYLADDMCVALEEIAPRDQNILADLYVKLSALLTDLSDPHTDDAGKWAALARWMERYDLDAFVDEVRQIGLATHEWHESEKTAKAMHDLRGGALSSLLGRLQLLDRLPRNSESLNVLFVLTRDHLKIMRNALVGLDEARRDADRVPKAHAMQLLLDKWQEAIVGPNWQQRPIRMHIDCRYEGALTECCLESAAIDRIFYNLTNNAARHAEGDIELVVFSLPNATSTQCLRFVLSNQIGETDAQRLRGWTQESRAVGQAAVAADDLPQLFEPKVSSTGSGFGLTVVADFVARAFGLKNRNEALQQRYVGAVLDGRTFRVWFHWPAAHNDLPPKLDDYRQPEQSLSEP